MAMNIAAATRRNDGEEDDDDEDPPPPISPAGAAATSSTSSSLGREYASALQTLSYNEIWSTIHHHRLCGGGSGVVSPASSSSTPSNVVAARVLRPGRASIEDALRESRLLSRLVSDYLDAGDRVSHRLISLRRSVDRARRLYAPIRDRLDLLLAAAAAADDDDAGCSLVQSALEALSWFDSLENPFPPRCDDLSALRRCFKDAEGKQRRRRGLRRVAGRALRRGIAVLLSCSGAINPSDGGGEGERDRRRRERSVEAAAARGAYVLEKHMGTIERLVSRLRARVEGDKVMVRLAMLHGGGDGGGELLRRRRRVVEEVLRQLQESHPRVVEQLQDLDEHVCICFAAVNRARSLLLHHMIEQQQH